MLQFVQPVWLLLLIPLLCSLRIWGVPSRLLTAVRAVFLILIVLAMSGPMLKIPSRNGTVIAVVDLSRSMPNESKTESIRAINLISQHSGPFDKTGVVSFGAKAFPERLPGPKEAFSNFSSNNSPDASDLAGAMEQALGLIPQHENGRIVLFTDGRFTGNNPINLVSRLIQRKIPVDFRLYERSSAGDVAVGMIDAPQLVSPQEAFTVSAWIRVPVSQEIQYDLLRDGQVISSGTKSMATGDNRLVFRDRATQSGTLNYSLRIKGQLEDPILENNTARRLVGVDGVKPLLILAQKNENGSFNTNLPRLFNASRIDTETVNAQNFRWSLPQLSGYSGIVIENVPASDLGDTAMELVAEWVKKTGSGMMMSGGKSSYALGGYYKSPLDDIMPVSMELREEHRKLAIAIVAVLDRSGSMAMPAGGGRTKMDLANIATADLLSILTPLDEIGVLAVDSVPHTVVALHPNNSVAADRSQILKVQSMGGGIFVYTGLRAAVDMLKKSSLGTKHIILFSDAMDSEEPGDYVNLLAVCEKAGITCSVIGLGNPTDIDADFLRDVAKRGKGQIYFTTEPAELPRFFAQDTFVITRSTFIEEPVSIRFTGGLTTLLGKTFSQPPSIGGYNLCYLKKGSVLSSSSEDEYTAPILSSWHAGLGRVLCYTGQIDGKFTGDIVDWPDYPSFLASIGRWTAGRFDKLPNNMMLSQEIVDGSLRIRLDLDPEREEASLEAKPNITILRQTANQPLESETIPMRWLEPEMLGVTVPLTGSETILATVSFGTPSDDPSQPAPISLSLPPVCLPYSPEFRPVEPGKGRELLTALAESTGGTERIEVAGIWNDIPKTPTFHDLAHCFLYLAVGLFTLEVFERRTGWMSAWLRRLWNRVLAMRDMVPTTTATKPAEKKPTSEPLVGDEKRISWLRQLQIARERRKTDGILPQSGVQTPAKPAEKAEKQPATKDDSNTGMLSALNKAKRSADKRTKL